MADPGPCHQGSGNRYDQTGCRVGLICAKVGLPEHVDSRKMFTRQSGPIAWIRQAFSRTGVVSGPGRVAESPEAQTKGTPNLDAWLHWVTVEEERQQKQEAWDRVSQQIRSERGLTSNHTPWIVGSPVANSAPAISTPPLPIGLVAHQGQKARIPLGLRTEVLERDDYTCRYCGRSRYNSDVTLHVDHIHPESEGGKTTIDNLVTACQDCNLGKGWRVLPNAIRLAKRTG